MRKIQLPIFFAFGLLLTVACTHESATIEDSGQLTEAAATVVRDLSWGNVAVRVEATPSGGRASLNDIVISGQVDDARLQPVMISESDPLTEAAVADLDHDGNPELYCFTQGAGSGSYGTVIAYTIFPDGSVTQINVQSISEPMQEGYMGHDLFSLEGDQLVRRFPVYREGDTNDKPTGGLRQVFYTLGAGEAAPQLVPERME